MILRVFRLSKPNAKQVEAAIASQRDLSFSYSAVGASQGAPPAGYNIDHHRILLGHGPETFAAAVSELKAWTMFDLGWVEVVPRGAPIKAGEVVAVVVQHLGFWSINVSRVVYTTTDDDESERYGFAYGTLACHAEQGEERFMIEYDAQTGEVWYDLYAFSKPRSILAKVGYPISRRLQKRFARDSLARMKRAVQAEHPLEI